MGALAVVQRGGTDDRWVGPSPCLRQHLAKGQGEGNNSVRVAQNRSALLYYVSGLRPISVLLI